MDDIYKSYELLSSINTVMWWALVAAALTFCISSLDNFFFDCVYWINRFSKGFRKKNPKKVYYDQISVLPEKRIAVMIPCWSEVPVIRAMLRSNLSEIDYKNYDVFVGLYANDIGTIAEVEKERAEFSNLYCAINSKEGPTTKGDNLNSMYEFIKKHELEKNIEYDIFVMHDSEDIIHPLSFKLYNYATDKYDMIQTPVFPLEVPLFEFTHWVYNDEFAEMHISSLLVRGFIHGLVPSAGVGTAFTRKGMNELVQHNKLKEPFSRASITEDYDASLRLQELKIKATFFPFSVVRIIKKKRWFGFGKPVPVEKQQIIATRALFPTNYFAAIKQRTRWVYGIALQEWKEIGWPGSFAMRFTLFHDRKSIVTHFFNGFGYIILLYWLISFTTNGFYHYHLTTLSEFLEDYAWMGILILISTFFMFERLLNRAVFTGSLYGFWPGLLSIPRTVYANLINIHTSYIALKDFIMVSSKRKKISWSKTSHSFPSPAQMAIYKRKIGDIMLDEGMISATHLKSAMVQQAVSHDKIGNILLEDRYIDLKHLTELLAHQHHLNIVDSEGYSVLEKSALKDMSSSNYEWLKSNQLLPIEISGNTVTIAAKNPEQLNNREEIQDKIAPYQANFALISLAHKLGDILVKKGLITSQQIFTAISDQNVTHQKLGPILVLKGYITQSDLNSALAEQYNLEVVNLDDYPILEHTKVALIKAKTYQWLIQNNLKPIQCDTKVITLVLSDPADEQLRKDAIKKVVPYEVKFVLASTMK